MSGTITDEIEFSLFQVEYLCRSVRVLDLFKLNPKISGRQWLPSSIWREMAWWGSFPGKRSVQNDWHLSCARPLLLFIKGTTDFSSLYDHQPPHVVNMERKQPKALPSDREGRNNRLKRIKGRFHVDVVSSNVFPLKWHHGILFSRRHNHSEGFCYHHHDGLSCQEMVVKVRSLMRDREGRR